MQGTAVVDTQQTDTDSNTHTHINKLTQKQYHTTEHRNFTSVFGAPTSLVDAQTLYKQTQNDTDSNTHTHINKLTQKQTSKIGNLLQFLALEHHWLTHRRCTHKQTPTHKHTHKNNITKPNVENRNIT